LRDILHSQTLLPTAHADLCDQLPDLGCVGGHSADDIRQLSEASASRTGAFDGFLNQIRSLSGSLGAALRQGTDFIRYNGEPQAAFTGPRRFDGGIEGQDIGLERNAVDGLDDLRYFLSGAVDSEDRTAHPFEGAVGLI
jgi:hypothetical protein